MTVRIGFLGAIRKSPRALTAILVDQALGDDDQRRSFAPVTAEGFYGGLDERVDRVNRVGVRASRHGGGIWTGAPGAQQPFYLRLQFPEPPEDVVWIDRETLLAHSAIIHA